MCVTCIRNTWKITNQKIKIENLIFFNGQMVCGGVSQENTQMANKHMERLSLSLVIGKIKIKMSVRYSAHPPPAWLKL